MGKTLPECHVSGVVFVSHPVLLRSLCLLQVPIDPFLNPYSTQISVLKSGSDISFPFVAGCSYCILFLWEMSNFLSSQLLYDSNVVFVFVLLTVRPNIMIVFF